MTSSSRTTPFPFTAIVGQEEMKRALVISAVDPTIGGVLIFGDRGTGKSTTVIPPGRRGFARSVEKSCNSAQGRSRRA
jgi:hypothetical protein